MLDFLDFVPEEESITKSATKGHYFYDQMTFDISDIERRLKMKF